jgi:hypothetical protein
MHYLSSMSLYIVLTELSKLRKRTNQKYLHMDELQLIDDEMIRAP